ncbi:hypothetical protein EZS27_008329 [termite gut metagenome]|uniref:Uncharacterized protein n=1 Tax=termite gut metagenome TaxID=433724 RepID=A0A5J4SFD3_9ZZZZ
MQHKSIYEISEKQAISNRIVEVCAVDTNYFRHAKIIFEDS